MAIPRPENDPERIETGGLGTATTEGCSAYGNGCKALVKGPFIVTDLIAYAQGGSYYLPFDPKRMAMGGFEELVGW